ncbi:hypothetical protein IFM89_037766 [Coptis chinensis]|uniref:NPH3 domain-containing protein n=1 Tax=Coptis chinensis TaxID=261450 RepID=A0A835M8G8_9MAGN|nr:hypothetical protein IFM89_037766 [Coptis chinensis]
MGLKEIVVRRRTNGYKKLILKDEDDEMKETRPRRWWVKKMNGLKSVKGFKLKSFSRKLQWRLNSTVIPTRSAKFYAEMVKKINMEAVLYPTIIHTGMVELSYSYNRKKLPLENNSDPHWNGVRKQQMVPKDWRIPGFSKGVIQGCDVAKCRSLVESIIWLLPIEKGSEQNLKIDPPPTEEMQVIRSSGFMSNTSKLTVAKLVDGYLAKIARDPNLPLSKFIDLAEMVSGFSRPAHDRLYRAIDMFLKEHSGVSKSERKRICKLMDIKKLTTDACMHAVQNERLPLRVVV